MQLIIVDSSLAIIKRLKELLSEEKYIKAVYEAITFEEAKAQIKEKNPDIIIIDTNVFDNKSIDLAKEISFSLNRPEIIALTNRNDHLTYELLKSQGVEYIYDKYHEYQKIPDAIRMISKKKIRLKLKN